MLLLPYYKFEHFKHVEMTMIEFAKKCILWVSEEIAAITAIGSLLAAIAALYSVKLVGKQIKVSQRPFLTIGNKTFFNLVFDLSTLMASGLRMENTDSKGESEESKYAYFELYNVGVGFAQSVTVEQSFDKDKAVNWVKENDTGGLFQSFRSTDSFFCVKCLGIEYYCHVSEKKEKRTLGNFPQLSIVDKIDSYSFREDFIMILNCVACLKKLHPFLNIETLPKLKINLSYYDIEGNKYQEDYVCDPFTASGEGYILTIKPVK